MSGQDPTRPEHAPPPRRSVGPVASRDPSHKPPARRGPALDDAPPPLRPRSANATIPLDTPEDDAPPAVEPAPVAAPPEPPVAPLPEDAPTAESPARPPPPPAPGPGTLPSDDLIEAELAEALSHTPVPPPAEPTPEPPPPRTRARGFPWTWLTPTKPPPPGGTAIRLSRHLAYEVVVVVVTFLVASALLFTSLNGEMRDVYVKTREAVGGYPAAVSGEVALVTVGSEALYLWNPADPVPDITPRPMLAELVGLLDEAGADVIVLDFLLDVPADGDARLAEAARAHGAVVAAERFVVTDAGSGARFAPGPAASLGDAVHSGIANLGEEALWTTSDDALVRSLRLVETLDRARLSTPWPMSVAEPQAEGEVTPHLALVGAWMHRQPEGDRNPDRLFADLQRACPDGVCTGDLTTLGLPPGPPLDARMPINLRGPEHRDGLPSLRAAELLRIAGTPALMRQAGVEMDVDVPDWLREQVEGRVVVIGRVDAASGDRFATPFSFPLPTHPDMDGCRIQAQAIDTLLSGRHVRGSSPALMWAFAAAIVGAILVSGRRFRDDIHTFGWLALAGGMVAVGAVVFILTDGVVLDLTPPLTAVLVGLVLARLRGWAVD